MKYTHEDGSPFTKKEFLEKLKTDKEFNDEFGNNGIHQISELIKQIKENPDSRRLLVSAWNPSELPYQVLPPCHYGFQVYTRELSLEERYKIMQLNISTATLGKPTMYNHEYYNSKNIPTRAISLMWNQRSCDFFLGIPYNVSSYALLLEIIAREVNMVPEEVIGNLGDTHLYLNHLDQAKEQITREPYELPTLRIVEDYLGLYALDFDKKLEMMKPSFFMVENYVSHPAIKAPLSN